jgi:tetratricopeptide (TPR) repeat protein
MTTLPDLDAIWDYNDPAGTELKFRSLAPGIRETGDVEAYAELLTQIARTEGLQRKFDEAHQTLELVWEALANNHTETRAYVRYLLERGRVFNSSDHPEEARSFFMRAWDLAVKLGEDNYAVDALHMIAIVAEPEAQMYWNGQALALAERSADPVARKWLGSLYNNMAWTHHDAGRYTEALDLFEKAQRFREETGQQPQLRIAKWSVARCLRSLGRVEEALTIQKTLLTESGGEGDGYGHEEIGECLLALGQSAEAGPYFKQAYALLLQDPWLAEHEAGRLARLKELAEGS